MTRDEIVSMIRQRLGFNQSFNEAHILLNMTYVQQTYELGHDRMPLPFFCFDGAAQIFSIPGQRNVPLPSGFIQLDDDWPITIEDKEGKIKPLDREPIYDLVALMQEEDGFPKYFEIDGDQVYLFPKPNDTYTIHFPHYAQTQALKDTTQSEWFTQFPNLLIEETTNSIMRSTRDLEGLKLSNVNAFRADYIARVEARMHVLKSYRSA